MERKRGLSPAVMAVLSGICAALWIYRFVFRGSHDCLTFFAGIAWAVSAVIWGLRAVREKE